MASLNLQLQGYRLTTAEILYHIPDHPALLQSYVWQEFDLSPTFPELKKFLDFWQKNLDGKMHSVKITNMPLITQADLYFYHHSLQLH